MWGLDAGGMILYLAMYIGEYSIAFFDIICYYSNISSLGEYLGCNRKIVMILYWSQ